ncbi:MAG: hypothetical protein MK135_08825 [Polyangiaceae bacterium]|nr:hypothetical protein [Polyangiaceae bacterium]
MIKNSLLLWPRPKRFRSPWTLLAAGCAGILGLFPGACATNTEPTDLSSLRRSGEATFLCVAADGSGRPLAECPQGARTEDGGLTVGVIGNELHALVTQTVSAEVAVIRVSGANEFGFQDGGVLDVDRSNPGVTPLRVGQKPVDIVTTPGGHASFVGVGEIGREGIFALPTSCIFEPKEKEDGEFETIRDLTTWPACSLPASPGAMVMLTDPPNEAGEVRESCSSPYVEQVPNSAPDRDECLADLGTEQGVEGRQKLLVALPQLGEIVVIDAQELLNRAQGSFDACKIEATLPLEVNIPELVTQPIPADLVVDQCPGWGGIQTYDIQGDYEARPSDFSYRDGALLVADSGAPIIHIIDAQEPCALRELDPLFATSLDSPERVVVTSKVEVSPKTPDGRQYVYALDEVGEQAASIMVYDITPGAVSRAPLVRSGSQEMPLEPADRIEFAAPVKDVSFALFDEPYVDPITETGTIGVRCDPDPNIPSDAVPARYRTASDAQSGALPATLRGLFGFALLGSGSLAVIDIDDFDAACRRPARLNPKSSEDFRGCFGDRDDLSYYTDDGTATGEPTVSDEDSCRAVDPHRARSRTLIKSSEGIGTGAPSLGGYARLSYDRRELPMSRLTTEGKKNPILLGVDFEPTGPVDPEEAQVFVGTKLFTRTDPDNLLIINPNIAEKGSIVLPFNQPRAYPTTETVTVAYEGDLDGLHQSGLIEYPEGGANIFTLRDQLGQFCDAGVQDLPLTAEVATERFSLDGEAVDRFAAQHGDYIQVVSDVADEDDPYWEENDLPPAPAGEPRTCGNTLQDIGQGRSSLFEFCDQFFADADTGTDAPARDMRILNAYQDHLTVELRNPERFNAQRVQYYPEILDCCFPPNLSYRIRGGAQWIVRGEATGFRHSVHAVENLETGQFECQRDCSPLVAGQQGRAFELSSTSCTDGNPEDISTCSVGRRTDDDLVCAYDSTFAVRPGSIAENCIFNGLTRRFAVYRGLEPSRRGMTFSVEVIGGFQNQGIQLTGVATDTAVILPVSLTALPSFQAMGVVDSQDRGLLMIDLFSSRVAGAFY